VKPVPWDPSARRMTQTEVAKIWADGQHCDSRSGGPRCHNLATVVTWRWFKSQVLDMPLLAENFYCDEHAEAFARGYKVTIQDAPGGGS
jgi:hypothetical protein